MAKLIPWRLGCDSPESLRVIIQSTTAANWTRNQLTSQTTIQSFAESIRIVVVTEGTEGDCQTVCDAVSRALQTLSIPHAIITGTFSTGPGIADTAPHVWLELPADALPCNPSTTLLVDPTAEQFMTEDFPHDIGVFTADDPERERYQEHHRSRQ